MLNLNGCVSCIIIIFFYLKKKKKIHFRQGLVLLVKSSGRLKFYVYSSAVRVYAFHWYVEFLHFHVCMIYCISPRSHITSFTGRKELHLPKIRGSTIG